jgi:hypothetical protein
MHLVITNKIQFVAHYTNTVSGSVPSGVGEKYVAHGLVKQYMCTGRVTPTIGTRSITAVRSLVQAQVDRNFMKHTGHII